jgi:hypothetical protein
MGGIYHICYSDDGSFAPAHTDIVPQRIEVKPRMAMAIAVSALKHVVSGRNWMGLELIFFAIFMGKNMET